MADFPNLLTKVGVKLLTSQGKGEEGRGLIMFTYSVVSVPLFHLPEQWQLVVIKKEEASLSIMDYI